MKRVLEIWAVVVAFVRFAFNQTVWYYYCRLFSPNKLYNDPKTLISKNVLVTGAASGMGKAISLHLYHRGCNVIATDKNAQALQALEAEVAQATRASGSIVIKKMDVSSQAEIDNIFNTTKVDYLISNAGIGSMGPSLEIPEEEYFRVFSINTLGAYRCAKAFFKQLRDEDQLESEGLDARIVIVTSGAAHTRFPFQSAYAVSKSGLEAFADVLRNELHPYGIPVSVIVPTAIETPIWDSLGATEAKLDEKYRYSIFLPKLLKFEQFFRSMRPTALPATKVAEAVERVLLEKGVGATRVIVDAAPFITRLVFAAPDFVKDFFMRYVGRST